MRLGAGEERRAFIDLVERVRADHQRVVTPVDHGLGEGEQCFTGTVDGQHVAGRIDPACGHVEPTLAPGRNGFAQGGNTQGRGVDGHLVQVAGQGFCDKAWRAVFRLADGQGDRALVGVGRHRAEQGAQFFERVGLELVQSVVHRCAGLTQSG
ncbi:hypothetical protein D3C78_1124040 [compost metagenome]